MNKSNPNNNQIFAEVNYDIFYIKQITPYLNHIKDDKGNFLRMKPRAFAWYYVFNNNVKADAYRRAFYSIFNKKTGLLEEVIPQREKKQKSETRNVFLSVRSAKLYNKGYTQQAIELIEKDYQRKIKKYIPQSMLKQLVIQATYDPSMFFLPNGDVAFKTWNEIPVEYRCCVEGIETRAYGKNADTLITTIKLVKREEARKHLLKVCPGLLEAEKIEIMHKTIDENGRPVGVNIDVKKLSDAELLQRYQELKGAIN